MKKSYIEKVIKAWDKAWGRMGTPREVVSVISITEVPPVMADDTWQVQVKVEYANGTENTIVVTSGVAEYLGL